MKREVDYTWRLAELMAAHGMHNSTDLIPRLAERGIQLSRPQVYRVVHQRPERVSLQLMAALCDILGCGVEAARDAILNTCHMTTIAKMMATTANIVAIVSGIAAVCAAGRSPTKAHSLSVATAHIWSPIVKVSNARAPTSTAAAAAMPTFVRMRSRARRCHSNVLRAWRRSFGALIVIAFC